MFRTPSDLARAALDLLEMTGLPEISNSPTRIGALELSAAIIANHVRDWHVKARGMKGSDGDKYFRETHQEWPILNDIANCTKHPHRKNADVSGANPRGPEWEDDEYWILAHLPLTLFVDVSGNERSVRALVWRFCTDYLATDASSSSQSS